MYKKFNRLFEPKTENCIGQKTVQEVSRVTNVRQSKNIDTVSDNVITTDHGRKAE